MDFSNFNILMYNNLVCPNCNYCDSYQEFLKEIRAAKTPKVTGNQFVNEEGFTGFKDEFTHTVDETILSYHLNLECLKQIPNSELRTGKSWQRLYWFYTDIGNKSWADYAAMKALEKFGQFLYNDSDSLATEEFMTLNIIMGELNLSVGRKTEAMECFEKNTNISNYQTHDLAVVSTRRFRELRG